MKKVLMGVLLVISFNCIYAAETSSSNIDSEWIYNYSSDTNKKYGLVTFTVVKNELGGLVEKINFDTKKMPMVSEAFQFERDLPLGNIVVDFINPNTRRGYHEFSPYLIKNKASAQDADISRFKVSTLNGQYLYDGSWMFNGKIDKVETIEFQGKPTEATKFVFYGIRPTDMQHCIEGQEGKVSAEVWYVKGVDRYVKQIIKRNHCFVGGHAIELDQETYTLSSFKNNNAFSITPEIPINNTKKDINMNKSIEQAKSKCKKLGFEEKTEKFGNCILEIIK